MSLTDLQQMGNQASPYGGVALGHAPQQPALGLGPNRYIPPTFNYGSNGQGSRPNYTQMDWNQMQSSYLPSLSNQGSTANSYMQQLRQMLGGFSQQYGDPNRRPELPQFGSYNPGFGGATSYYDQQSGGGQGRGQMPQFNPYMLMQNNLRGMDFNQMFDPRYAALFGGNSFGSSTPNSQQNAASRYIKPQAQFIDGQYASGGKPGGV